MVGLALAAVATVLAAIPALLFVRNLLRYRPPAAPPADWQARVSVLIPARNEEAGIAEALETVLASQQVDLEVLVLDDRSEDDTGREVERMAATDDRVKLLHGVALPSGWCGKQHACWLLAQAASRPLMVFMDADVRLDPECLARLAFFREQTGAALVSGFPRQVVETWMEKLVLPLMHFVLLGFLPMGRMRRTTRPQYAAGCGQLILVPRDEYFDAGGHEALKASLHDGIRLPRTLREAGHRTDLCDVTHLASCRMYRHAGEVFSGLAKNAHEGMGSPRLIGPATALLAGGQVLPFGMLAAAPWLSGPALGLAAGAALLAWLPRFLAAWRFRQPLVGALFHPLGVTLFLYIQWWAAWRRWRGRPATWKGRSYPVEAS